MAYNFTYVIPISTSSLSGRTVIGNYPSDSTKTIDVVPEILSEMASDLNEMHNIIACSSKYQSYGANLYVGQNTTEHNSANVPNYGTWS